MMSYKRSSGFSLVASLLILVVLTLLGVSSISNVGLQERMASNLKEKERATEIAEVAARSSEQTLDNRTDPPRASSDGSGDNVWERDGPLPNNDIYDLLTDTYWDDALEFTAAPFDNDDLIGVGLTADHQTKYVERPKSYTEEYDFEPADLSPEALAKRIGDSYYRISGRGVGGNATAVSITQSMFMQRYN